VTLLRSDEVDTASDAWYSPDGTNNDFYSAVFVWRLQGRLEEARARNQELEKLAYVGDHHHPDLSFKALCDSEVQLKRETERCLTEIAQRIGFKLSEPPVWSELVIAVGVFADAFMRYRADATRIAGNVLDHYDQLANDITTDPGFENLRRTILLLSAFAAGSDDGTWKRFERQYEDMAAELKRVSDDKDMAVAQRDQARESTERQYQEATSQRQRADAAEAALAAEKAAHEETRRRAEIGQATMFEYANIVKHDADVEIARITKERDKERAAHAETRRRCKERNKLDADIFAAKTDTIERLTKERDDARAEVEASLVCQRVDRAAFEQHAAALTAHVESLASLVRRFEKSVIEYAAFHGPCCDDDSHSGESKAYAAECDECRIDVSFPTADEVYAALASIEKKGGG
jgi:hypothetical protein